MIFHFFTLQGFVPVKLILQSWRTGELNHNDVKEGESKEKFIIN
jgi:hypothetical protein